MPIWQARIVILATGVSMVPGETRLELLGRNAAIFAEVIPQVLKFAVHAVLVVATDPVDVVTHLAARYAGELGCASWAGDRFGHHP